MVFLISGTATEIIYPSISPFKWKTKRTTELDDNPSLKIHFKAFEKDFNLALKFNDKILAPHSKVEIIGRNGSILHVNGLKNCFYSGTLTSEKDSLVSMANCNGLVSHIFCQSYP